MLIDNLETIMWVGIVALVILIGTWVKIYRRAALKYPGAAKAAFVGHTSGLFAGIVFALLFLIIAIEGFGAGGSSKKGEDSVASTAATVAATNNIEVDAKDLFKDYEANEVAADKKYKVQHLSVMGKVKSVDKDAFGHIVLRMEVPNQFMGVMATILPKFEDVAARVVKGQYVFTDCIGNGRLIGSPILRDCGLSAPESGKPK